MARFGSASLTFPDFHGATRRLVLWNLVAYFVLAVAGLASNDLFGWLFARFVFLPKVFLGGWLWQPLTYSFVHLGIMGTAFELLSLWFLAGFLENFHRSDWVMGLYAASVLGTALAATALYVGSAGLGHPIEQFPLFGCFGGIFGLLAAIGLLYGDLQFQLFFVIGIKARYMVAIYALISIAMLFGQQ